MSTMAYQITSFTIVYSTIYSCEDQRKHQSSTSLPFVRIIHRWPVKSPHKEPVTRKMFPFDDVIISLKRRRLTGIGTWNYKPKTAWTPSQIYNGNPYINKWIECQLNLTGRDAHQNDIVHNNLCIILRSPHCTGRIYPNASPGLRFSSVEVITIAFRSQIWHNRYHL